MMLSKKIKTLRIAKGINQVEMANSLGVSKQCISNWENDNILPSIEMLVKLSKYYNVSTDYLLGLDTKRNLSVEGLTESQIAHISLIIEDLKNES